MTDIEKRGISYWTLYMLLPVMVLVVWFLAGMAGYTKSYSMPSLDRIGDTVVQMAESGKLFENMYISVVRVLEGFIVSLVAGIALGIVVSISSKFEILTDFIIQILRPIPPIAWIPLAILWFGIGESSKIFIIFLGGFFPIFVNCVDGIKNIDRKYYELASVYEVSKKELIIHIIIPGALPSMLTGIRLGISNAWVCVVAAEMIGATSGVGYMLSNGRSLSRPDIVILGMLIVGIVGKIMDDILRKLNKKLIKWV